ncbi:hypothetical protein shim_35130 [Shimia sp. SK013]|nr:hypothetical protein shim_35130 [Shimia sp. SK013]
MLQHTLLNGKQDDCLIHRPNPPEPIVIESIFPLEAYEMLRNASPQGELNEAGAIRKELGLLHKDVDRHGTRVENLDRQFTQAAKDVSEIRISADKAGRRARRLDSFDFEELAPDEREKVVPLTKPEG